jgi:hypothetical protein
MSKGLFSFERTPAGIAQLVEMKRALDRGAKVDDAVSVKAKLILQEVFDLDQGLPRIPNKDREINEADIRVWLLDNSK